jgi:hypothetical protein
VAGIWLNVSSKTPDAEWRIRKDVRVSAYRATASEVNVPPTASNRIAAEGRRLPGELTRLAMAGVSVFEGRTAQRSQLARAEVLRRLSILRLLGLPAGRVR